MHGKNFEDVLDTLLEKESRYARAAYHFVRQALAFSVGRAQKQSSSQGSSQDTQHIKGPELLNGIKDYAIDQFGPMAHMLFSSWGIQSGEDFGHIVFNLIDAGVLTKTEDDCIDDFRGVLDFYEAFVRPYLPRFPKKKVATRRSRKTRPSTFLDEDKMSSKD